MTKRFITSMLTIALLICNVCFMSLPASAATSSDGTTRTQRFTITTMENYWFDPSITFGQTKGIFENRYTDLFQSKTCKSYGKWEISYKARGEMDYKTVRLTGSSKKITLEYGKTYDIEVKWAGDTVRGHFTTYPTWNVKKTWGLSSDK